MMFCFETTYNQKAFTAMSRALRKTVRKRKNRFNRLLFGICALLVFLLTVGWISDGTNTESFNMSVTWIAFLIMLLVVIFEDSINGYIGKKRMLSKMTCAKSVFYDGVYRSETEIGKTEFLYENIGIAAETKEYFVFIFDKNHAQVYDKSKISGGTADDFRRFITEKTGKTFLTIN